jgi:hypothetical protein
MIPRLTSLIAVLLAACGDIATPPPPTTVHSVAVFPPSNRTGDGLVVAGASLLEKYAIRTDRVTVPDVLAAELRSALAHRGFDVVASDTVHAVTGGRTIATPDAAAEMARQGHLEVPVLLVAIERWEPDAPTHPAFVIVALEATLVDPATGSVLWSAHRRASPIATSGTVVLATAYEIAAHKAAEELVGAWGDEQPPS